MSGDRAHIALIRNAAPRCLAIRSARKTARVTGQGIFCVIWNGLSRTLLAA